ncbi:MAG: amino acid permease [Caulobacter sp.]|nr:amino acid permease [Caulobacter sp.]
MKAERKIGPVLATALVAGNMIGSGIFLLPASLAHIGSSTVIGWVVSLGGALLLAGVFALLAATRPSPDGLVQWPAKVHPAFGFVSWAAYWATGWIGTVAVILAGVGYLGALLPALKSPLGMLAATLGMIWLFTLLALFGARLVTRFSGLTLIIGLAPVLIAIGLGFAAFSPDIFAASWNVTGKPLLATVPPSLLIIFWAFLGLESANIAEAVVDNPRRNVPIAALGGVLVAGMIYIAASVAVMGVIPAAELQLSTAPFAEVVARVAGPAAGMFVAVCAILKICGTTVGWFLVNGESGRSGAAAGYLPRFMSESDPDILPRRGLVILAVLMSLVSLATISPTLNDQFNAILNLSVTLVMAVYALCALALLLDGGQTAASRLLGLAALGFTIWVVVASGLPSTWPGLVLLALAVPVGWVLQRRGARG